MEEASGFSHIENANYTQNVHDWDVERSAREACTPQQLLDSYLNMTFRSQEKIVDLKRIIGHLVEADRYQSQAYDNQQLLQHQQQETISLLSMDRERQGQEQRQSELGKEAIDYGQMLQNTNLRVQQLQELNKELKDVNKQWYDFWNAQKQRLEAELHAKDQTISSLRQQLEQQQQPISSLAAASTTADQLDFPTESLIADTGEIVRRLTAEKAKAEEQLSLALANNDSLQQENAILNAQIVAFREDFDNERRDREAALTKVDELKEQLDRIRLGWSAPATQSGAPIYPQQAAQPIYPQQAARPSYPMQQPNYPLQQPQPNYPPQQQQQHQPPRRTERRQERVELPQPPASQLQQERQQQQQQPNEANAEISDTYESIDRLVRQQAAAEASVGAVADSTNQWQCQHCTLLNEPNAAVCTMCSRSRTTQHQEEQRTTRDSRVWSCPRCQVAFDYNQQHCDICETARPQPDSNPYIM